MAIKKRDIYGELSAKYGLRRDVIETICNHPFIFASRRMTDPTDEKTIMFPYFGKIRLKKRLHGKKYELAVNGNNNGRNKQATEI